MARLVGDQVKSRWVILRWLAHADTPLPGLGMASVCLGLIGLLLFFLPILGMPVSLCGFVAGVVGLVVALFTGGPSLRWSLGGIVVSAAAFGVGLVMYATPEGYVPASSKSQPWRTPNDRPFVAPPAVNSHAAAQW